MRPGIDEMTLSDQYSWIHFVPAAIRRPGPLVLMGLLGFTATCLQASGDVPWDGINYLRVPVRLGSDTRLVMPEPFDDSWEHDSEVACTLLDDKTLIIRPRVAVMDQRLTLRGRISGTLYLARVSNVLPYVPVVTVRTALTDRQEDAAGSVHSAILGLLKAMMLGSPPPGYQILKSERLLFDQAPYRIVAQQVWRSLRQTGIVARISSTLPSQAIPIVPANILVRIPELGSLKAMAADDFDLNAGRVSTRIYLVYAK